VTVCVSICLLSLSCLENTHCQHHGTAALFELQPKPPRLSPPPLDDIACCPCLASRLCTAAQPWLAPATSTVVPMTDPARLLSFLAAGASFAEGCTVRINLTATTPAATGPGAKPATAGVRPATPSATTSEAGPAATVPPATQPQALPAQTAPAGTAVVPAAVVAPTATQPGALPAVLPVVPVGTAPLPSVVPAGKK
jgi:hypothetical protein